MKLCWLVLSIAVAFDDPFDFSLRDRADVIEVNHYHDANGKPVLSQLIFHDWNPQTARLEICDYKLLRTPLHEPTFIGTGERAFCLWLDDQTPRFVIGKQVIESWTQYDPENWQRRLLPADDRRGMRRR